MKLCRNEEIIFREINALSGDLAQIAEALTRIHEERNEEAERMKKQLEEQRGVRPVQGFGMRVFDTAGLSSDLNFIRQRLELLCSYLERPPKEAIFQG